MREIRLFDPWRFFIGLFLVAYLQTPAIVKAQSYLDLIKINYVQSRHNNFINTQGEADVREFDVDVTIPVVLNKSNNLITGLLFEAVTVDPYPNLPAIGIYTINPKIGLNRTYSTKWSATYVLLPKLMSDIQAIDGQDFQIGAVSIFKYTKSATLNYKLGLYYNTDLFGPFVVPMAGFYYLLDRFEANLMAPLSADINYKLTGPLKVGFLYSGFKKSFAISEPYKGLTQYLAKINNEALAYLDFSIGDIHIQGMLGRSLGRKYQTFEQGDRVALGFPGFDLGDNRTQLNDNFKDGYVFKLSIFYRYQL